LPYLAAVLQRDGHNVKLIDCEGLCLNHKQLGEKLRSLKPQVVGITSTTTTIHAALLSAKATKEECPNAIVVLGGPHVTFMDQEVFDEEPSVDIIVRGEGEQTLSELVAAIEKSGTANLDKIAGLSFKREGKIVRTPDRPPIQDLDSLPRPAFDQMPLENYRVGGRKILPILTSRGCPYQCSFCVSSQVNGKIIRTRSIKSVVDEIEWIRDTHGATAFTFYDDAFTYYPERAAEICDEIIRRGIKLPWNCQVRVDNVTQPLLAKMKAAGCENVYFGVESGNQGILDAVGKKTSVQQNELAVKWSKDAGLFVITSLVIGYPGETVETLKQTIALVHKLKPDDAYLCVATPYPGTALYKLIQKNGWKISSDWSEFDTATPVFENPNITKEQILAMRKKFVDDFYSPAYIVRQYGKGNYYNRLLARIALSHIIWRVKLALR
jgi:anaerobic magnesium-protoporphyrin IX monomethyl ester cyclase